MELDLTKKPLVRSVSQLMSEIQLFSEVLGTRPNRIAMSQSQFDWYVGLLKKTAEDNGLSIKPIKLLEPSFLNIPVYIRNDKSIQ